MQKNISKILRKLQKNIKEMIKTIEIPQSEETFEQKTIKMVKQQQDLGKITVKDSTEMLAKKIGIKHINKKINRQILDSALYNLKHLRRLALKEKIEKPLKLNTSITEKQINKLSISKLKKLIKQKTSKK